MWFGRPLVNGHCLDQANLEDFAGQGEPGQEPLRPDADNLLANSHQEPPPMSDTPGKVQEERPANLTALHRQLEELAARTKPSSPLTADRWKDIQGPVLVVRGK